MHLFFQLAENELHIKLQKKKLKKKEKKKKERGIRVAVLMIIYQSFFKLINFFFKPLNLSTTTSSISLSEQ